MVFLKITCLQKTTFKTNARFQHLSFKFNFPTKISVSLEQGGGAFDPGSRLVKLTFT